MNKDNYTKESYMSPSLHVVDIKVHKTILQGSAEPLSEDEQGNW